MDSKRIYLVTDVTPEGQERCALLVGPSSHQGAIDALYARHPDRQPIAVVAMADLEATLANVKSAVKTGISEHFQVIKTP